MASDSDAFPELETANAIMSLGMFLDEDDAALLEGGPGSGTTNSPAGSFVAAEPRPSSSLFSGFGETFKQFTNRGRDGLTESPTQTLAVPPAHPTSQGYKFGDVTRGVIKDALPMVRENLHKFKMGALEMKEQAKEQRQQLIKKVVNALELPDGQGSPSGSSAVSAQEMLKWWNMACEKAHQPHTGSEDPPEPSARGAEAAAAADGEPLREARGCLEVSVRAFTRVSAAKPVCQLALGGRCTGAMLPRGMDDPSCSVARFAIDELAGCDLRIHVFDKGSAKFAVGLEDKAFCGGAFLPLSVFHDRRPLLSQVHEVEVAVPLLPLEAMRERCKLSQSQGNYQVKPPSSELGHVYLLLKLTLFDRPPALMLTSTPFRGESPERLVSHGRIEDPMSVVAAVFVALQRLKTALDVGPFVTQTVDELRETPHTSAILYAVWSYSMLLAAPWQVPSCSLLMLALITWQMAQVSRNIRQKNPARLYVDDTADPDKDQTLQERTVSKIRHAVKMEMDIIQFATTLTRFAMQVERIRFVISFRDPTLSSVCALFALGGTLLATVAVVMSRALFGRLGPFVLAWALGCVLFLPRAQRAKVREGVAWAKQQKERLLGPSKLELIIKSLWQRIPDQLESLHFELATQNVVFS